MTPTESIAPAASTPDIATSMFAVTVPAFAEALTPDRATLTLRWAVTVPVSPAASTPDVLISNATLTDPTSAEAGTPDSATLTS